MAKLICTLEMSKERGVTVIVENVDQNITQRITMDGTTLTLEVEGQQDTSTWTQTADKISISCKDFELVASNSITCTASQTISLESEQGDTTIRSGAKLTQAASGDATLSSKANTTVSASSAVKLAGATAKVAADSSLTLSGSSSAELSGPMVTISADATLSAKSSGTASLEGSMTTIKGSLITAG